MSSVPCVCFQSHARARYVNVTTKILASSWLWLKRVCDTASTGLFCVFSVFAIERVCYSQSSEFSSLPPSLRRHAELLHVCAAHRMFYHHFFNIAFGMSQIRPRPYICHPPPRFFPHAKDIYLFPSTFYYFAVKREREMEKEVRSDFGGARATWNTKRRERRKLILSPNFGLVPPRVNNTVAKRAKVLCAHPRRSSGFIMREAPGHGCRRRQSVYRGCSAKLVPLL